MRGRNMKNKPKKSLTGIPKPDRYKKPPTQHKKREGMFEIPVQFKRGGDNAEFNKARREMEKVVEKVKLASRWSERENKKKRVYNWITGMYDEVDMFAYRK